MKINVILPCGGCGSRVGLGYNKLKFDIGGMSVLQKTISCWAIAEVSKIIIAASQNDLEWVKNQTADLHQNIQVCVGGDNRTLSVYNALKHVEYDCDYIAVHDGARPFLSQQVINNALECCLANGNACVSVACKDSLRKIDNNQNCSVDRNQYVRMQTPQIFKRQQLIDAYQKAIADNKQFSDDATLYQQYQGKIYLSAGDENNIKITTIEDVYRFVPSSYLIGNGWDTHQLVCGRRLILGGVEIPHTKGLLGHSDADVLTHAIMDALLTASHNRDIGCLFPDSDNSYKDANSMLLLKKVCNLIISQGYQINNVSATIMAQKPKLAEYIIAMTDSLAACMEIDSQNVSISATTTEKLGLVGSEQAISVSAVCSIRKI